MPIIDWPQPELITDLARDFEPDPAEYEGLSILPMDTTRNDNSPIKIKWDILGASNGLLQAHALNTEAALVSKKRLKTKEMKTAFWKEKMIFDEEDLLTLRGIGTNFQRRYAMEMIAEGMADLRSRLWSRVEQLIWACLHGTLTFSSNGVIRSIDYEIPAGNKFNAAVKWSTLATADPITDIQTMEAVFAQYGARLKTIYMNKANVTKMAQNVAVRTLVRNSSEVLRIGESQVANLAMQLAGVDGEIKVYDKGYNNSSGAFTRFLSDSKVVFVAEGPARLGKLGRFQSTPSLYNGGISGATGGEFMIPIDMSNEEDNPYYALVSGIYGLPVLVKPMWVGILTTEF